MLVTFVASVKSVSVFLIVSKVVVHCRKGGYQSVVDTICICLVSFVLWKPLKKW